jgi:D-lactate dehydrogenase
VNRTDALPPPDSDLLAALDRTCEIGLTRATGQPYRHILQVLDDTLGGRNA